MKITTLVENKPSTTDPRLLAEWGLSLHINFNGKSILFDSGASEAFADNAEKLAIDLANVDTAVLSHHHYDHGGGLRRFFAVNAESKVYLGKEPKGECYGKALGLKKYIGLDRNLFVDFPQRFLTVSQPVEILPDVFLFPDILAGQRKPGGNNNLFLQDGTSCVHDDFSHEIVMAIKENGKLIIFTGCSHNGVLNMMATVAASLPGIPVKALIGGFHIVETPILHHLTESKDEIKKLAASLAAYPVDVVYTGHCTADRAFTVLQSVLGDCIKELRTGASFEV